jgi:hypothetical protein
MKKIHISKTTPKVDYGKLKKSMSERTIEVGRKIVNM